MHVLASIKMWAVACACQVLASIATSFLCISIRLHISKPWYATASLYAYHQLSIWTSV